MRPDAPFSLGLVALTAPGYLGLIVAGVIAPFRMRAGGPLRFAPIATMLTYLAICRVPSLIPGLIPFLMVPVALWAIIQAVLFFRLRRWIGHVIGVCSLLFAIGIINLNAPSLYAGYLAPPDRAIQGDARGNVTSSAAGGGAPNIPDNFVLEPTIHAELGTYSAGTAFAIRLPPFKRPLVLSCLHIFGVSGGYPRDIPPLELPAVVREISLSDKYNGASVGDISGGIVPIPGSAILGTRSEAGDIVAIWALDKIKVSPGILADDTPRIGEPVWLASPDLVWLVWRLIGGADPPRRLHRAVVSAVENNLFEYQFDEVDLELRGTSGSPILNSKGEVVAIHIGGTRTPGLLVGTGNPVFVFRPRLIEACLASPPGGQSEMGR